MGQLKRLALVSAIGAALIMAGGDNSFADEKKAAQAEKKNPIVTIITFPIKVIGKILGVGKSGS